MLNKNFFIGRVGNDPEIKTMQSSDRVANFSLAVSEKWKDKQTGAPKERTEWLRVVCFNQHIVKVIENYVTKGSKIYVEAQVQTRDYEKDGQKVYVTEFVMTKFKGELILLDSKGATEPSTMYEDAPRKPVDELEDEIPF